MPLDLKCNGNASIALEIADNGNVGFGCAASSSQYLVVGGYTLLSLLYAFRPGCFLSQTATTVPISVQVTPNQTIAVNIQSYITGGLSTAHPQPGVGQIISISNTVSGGGLGAILNQDTTNLYITGTQTSGTETVDVKLF